MLLIPAIDLKDGRCVRLRQGDMDDVTVFSEDPAEMARHWVDQGARRLHLVDLNGAIAGKPRNEASIKAIVAEVGAPNLKVQMDLYHCQIVEGDVATRIRHYLPTGNVGHFQIAGVPQRHEPDIGELHHPYLFSVIDELAWDGWIGCEYRPRAGTTAGLGWMKPYL